jgi:hypothetical protein
VSDSLQRLYRVKQDQLANYQKVFKKLRLSNPSYSKIKFCIQVELRKESNVWEVFAYELDDPYSVYDLEFEEWESWLSMKIHEQLLQTLGKSDFMAHCLMEMTKSGFTQEEIQKKAEERGMGDD